jgi:hypothetical protein
MEELGGHAGGLHHALLDFTCSGQASAEHFQHCTEFLPLRNRGLGPLAVAVLSVALARRVAVTRMPIRCPIGPAQRTLRLNNGSSRLYG